MMSRKDYQLIAQALRSSWEDHGTPPSPDDTAHAIADALQADNPRFDRDRFLIAAGCFS